MTAPFPDTPAMGPERTVSSDGTSTTASSTKGSGGPGKRRSALTSQLRKTKICVYHLRGTCHFGSECAFAHNCTEIQSTPDLRKTRLCRAFEEGMCMDPTCDFAHGEVELKSTDLFFKRTLCIWNEKGKCRNGDQCRFAHGKAELRPSGREAVATTTTPPPAAAHGTAKNTSFRGRAGSGQSAQHAVAKAPANGPMAKAMATKPAARARADEPMKVMPVNPEAFGVEPQRLMQRFPQHFPQDVPVDVHGANQNQAELKANLERLRDQLSELTLKCGQLWNMQGQAVPPNVANLGLTSLIPGGVPPGLGMPATAAAYDLNPSFEDSIRALRVAQGQMQPLYGA